MTRQATQSLSRQSMTLLSRLLLIPQDGNRSSPRRMVELQSSVRDISREEFNELVALASSNHVVVRGLDVLLSMVHEAKDDSHVEWVEASLAAERARIDRALITLQDVCTTLECEGHDVVVIKSLDHWPDLGSDLDLYTNSKPEDITRLMKGHFNAQIASRSWGDRLAGKWNFLIPGLPEAVEIHMGRLGQTGEQDAIASHLVERSRHVMIGNQAFRVPCSSDRLMISTLQRMYRHFYFRLCDIVDTAALSETGGIDYIDLRSSATNAG